MKKVCKSCGWGRQTLNSDTVFICGCPLSGAYGTHVIESDGCDRWKKASDEYLKLTGCLEDSDEKA